MHIFMLLSCTFITTLVKNKQLLNSQEPVCFLSLIMNLLYVSYTFVIYVLVVGAITSLGKPFLLLCYNAVMCNIPTVVLTEK